MYISQRTLVFQKKGLLELPNRLFHIEDLARLPFRAGSPSPRTAQAAPQRRGQAAVGPSPQGRAPRPLPSPTSARPAALTHGGGAGGRGPKGRRPRRLAIQDGNPARLASPAFPPNRPRAPRVTQQRPEPTAQHKTTIPVMHRAQYCGSRRFDRARMRPAATKAEAGRNSVSGRYSSPATGCAPQGCRCATCAGRSCCRSRRCGATWRGCTWGPARPARSAASAAAATTSCAATSTPRTPSRGRKAPARWGLRRRRPGPARSRAPSAGRRRRRPRGWRRTCKPGTAACCSPPLQVRPSPGVTPGPSPAPRCGLQSRSCPAVKWGAHATEWFGTSREELGGLSRGSVYLTRALISIVIMESYGWQEPQEVI